MVGGIKSEMQQSEPVVKERRLQTFVCIMYTGWPRGISGPETGWKDNSTVLFIGYFRVCQIVGVACILLHAWSSWLYAVCVIDTSIIMQAVDCEVKKMLLNSMQKYILLTLVYAVGNSHVKQTKCIHVVICCRYFASEMSGVFFL